ncbi:MAG: phosphoribosyltransferase-like protein [Yoonia sp.]
MDLFMRRQNLEDLEVPILELAGQCKSNEEFEVVQHILEKFILLSDSQFEKYLRSLAKSIEATFASKENVALVAMAWNEGADSSQMVLQRLKAMLPRSGNLKLFNSVPMYLKKENMKDYPHFILIDDFAGTGKTVRTRYKHIISESKSRNFPVTGEVKVVFGMEKAFEFLSQLDIDVEFLVKLKPGLSGYFSGDELSKKSCHMNRLEAGLAQIVEGKFLPGFGYGRAEALFCLKGQNAPNSNFPILWWPEDWQGSQRNTLVFRSEL